MVLIKFRKRGKKTFPYCGCGQEMLKKAGIRITRSIKNFNWTTNLWEGNRKIQVHTYKCLNKECPWSKAK